MLVRLSDPWVLVIACLPVLLCLAVTTAPSVEAKGPLEKISWLLGSWRLEGKDTVTREKWVAVSSSTWEGEGIESKADGTVLFQESLRIMVMGGGIFYLAKVGHNPLPIAFSLMQSSGTSLVFENPAHDFPRRLTYTLQSPDRLKVRVEGKDEKTGKDAGFELSFTRE
jgi:hypothetical protein